MRFPIAGSLRAMDGLGSGRVSASDLGTQALTGACFRLQAWA
jgi:hypothetical protein